MIDEDSLAAYCAAAILGDCEIQEIAARVVVQQKINLRCVKLKIWEAAPKQERLRLVSTFRSGLSAEADSDTPAQLTFQKEWAFRDARSRETTFATFFCGKKQSTTSSKSRRLRRATRLQVDRPTTHPTTLRVTTPTNRSAT